ncbi:luciferase family oxidoreductase, group 1 [Lentzea xinjiangensis]|uniref:Luciferase family oxidoreductase, group 1 n=1 Tax=Lentzea xinjiangensis TaxID=402600 RepID=A0A1H9M054_9PSEU|nr:LLM class flavin-dependent oxidoreductase [Lentzea xinjiangensis]SER17048.1 luciferase family oxidoreductase, group 1 [Lentzea xinjiangensis]
MGIRLSVLDTSPVVQGSTPRQALRDTVDLAELAEELGFHRYWVPEHHGMRGVASSAPAVLAGHLAAVTSRLRIGAGGVLLPNHPPLVVAEQFGTLAALHPGRIDLGVGRAPGGPPHVVASLRRTGEPYRSQLEELLALLDPAGTVAVPVRGGNVPSPWLLGSSPATAALAAELGLPFAFARHLSPDRACQADLVSVSVIAAEDDARAQWLAGPIRAKVRSRREGTRILLPHPDDVPHPDDMPASPDDGRVLVGGPETITRKLQAVLDETGTEELMITSPIYHHADRRRSYELVAAVGAGLRPAGGASLPPRDH